MIWGTSHFRKPPYIPLLLLKYSLNGLPKRLKKRNNADAKRHDLEQQLEKASGLREGAAVMVGWQPLGDA